MDDNKITHIAKYDFEGYDSLVVLSLKNNELRSIEKGSFMHFQKLVLNFESL